MLYFLQHHLELHALSGTRPGLLASRVPLFARWRPQGVRDKLPPELNRNRLVSCLLPNLWRRSGRGRLIDTAFLTTIPRMAFPCLAPIIAGRTGQARCPPNQPTHFSLG